MLIVNESVKMISTGASERCLDGRLKNRKSEGGAEEPVNLWGRRVHRGEQGHGQGLQIKLGQDDGGGQDIRQEVRCITRDPDS